MREKIKDKWRDLGPRVVSGLALAAIGGTAFVLGGLVFLLFISICAGLMVWETSRMAAPEKLSQNKILGVIAGVAVFGAIVLPMSAEGLVFIAVAIAVYVNATRDRLWLSLYALLVMVAWGTMWFLREVSFPYSVWLICVVVASDVLGYFAGRTLGGPKFWPAISPKKTWSGTVAGWIGAAAIGFWFAKGGVDNALALAITSVFMAFAGQMGDIVESALKRRAGVKDSSNLIPGHGGLLDRFDALMFAAIIMGGFLAAVAPFVSAKGH